MTRRPEMPAPPPSGFAPCPRCHGGGVDVLGLERGEPFGRVCTRCGGGGFLASQGPHEGPPYVACDRCNRMGDRVRYILRGESGYEFCLHCAGRGFLANWRV